MEKIMSQHVQDYMTQCSTSELREVIEVSKESERQARLDGTAEMASYHAWTRFYAERELTNRSSH
jgi:hypothetical protein